MKYTILGILLLSGALSIVASPADTDTIPTPKLVINDTNKILIVPFYQEYFFSDANEELKKYNQMGTGKIIDYFRYGLDINLNQQLVKTTPYFTEQILLNDSGRAGKDLREIYGNLDYEYSKPIVPLNNKDKKGHVLKTIKGWVKKVHFKRPELEYEDIKKDLYKVKLGDGSEEFFNAKVQNDKMFADLNKSYGTNTYLFINQIDIKTNYQVCLDRGSEKFIREFIVHFSIYNKDGKQVYGNKATYFTDNRSIDIDVIVDEDLYEIANQIVALVPETEDPLAPTSKSKRLFGGKK